MLRLSRLSDYSVVLLAHLARSPGVHSVQTVASATGLPAPTVAKLLKMLVKANIVRSVRGVAGGYRLERSPHEVTVTEVIRAIEGPVALTACVESGDGDCLLAEQCLTRGAWDQVNRALIAALDALTLASLIQPRTAAPPALPVGSAAPAVAPLPA